MDFSNEVYSIMKKKVESEINMKTDIPNGYMYPRGPHRYATENLHLFILTVP